MLATVSEGSGRRIDGTIHDSTGGKTMSYATMQDALFALDLADSELWDRPRHPEESTDEPELPTEPGKSRRTARRIVKGRIEPRHAPARFRFDPGAGITRRR